MDSVRCIPNRLLEWFWLRLDFLTLTLTLIVIQTPDVGQGVHTEFIFQRDFPSDA